MNDLLSIQQFIEEKKPEILEELFGLLRIPSVSARPEHKKDMKAAAGYLSRCLLDAGADKAQVMETFGIPLVYGEKIIDENMPTVLVYGHYDVKPAGPVELWKSSPFEPEIRDEKIFARGADDNKGQFFMQLKAFEYLNKTGQLKCNVKFIIEGEEEIGSPSLKNFCKKHRDLLKCDIVMVSDTAMVSRDIPSITIGLEGLIYLEMEVREPKRDLHSVLTGEANVHPVNTLAGMIAMLTDIDNRIVIPGFYDDMLPISAAERKLLTRAPFRFEDINRTTGNNTKHQDEKLLLSKWQGTGSSSDIKDFFEKNEFESTDKILPTVTQARISMQLSPDQQSLKVSKLFEEHFKSVAPQGVQVKVRNMYDDEKCAFPLNTTAYRAAGKAFEKAFGKTPVPTRSEGSIPIIADFEEVLGVKSILIGFGLESDAIHSPNEHFPLFNFFKGIETISYFYNYFQALRSE